MSPEADDKLLRSSSTSLLFCFFAPDCCNGAADKALMMIVASTNQSLSWQLAGRNWSTTSSFFKGPLGCTRRGYLLKVLGTKRCTFLIALWPKTARRLPETVTLDKTEPRRRSCRTPPPQFPNLLGINKVGTAPGHFLPARSSRTRWGCPALTIRQSDTVYKYIFGEVWGGAEAELVNNAFRIRFGKKNKALSSTARGRKLG